MCWLERLVKSIGPFDEGGFFPPRVGVLISERYLLHRGLFNSKLLSCLESDLWASGCIQYGIEWVANVYRDGEIYVASMLVVCIDLDQLSTV